MTILWQIVPVGDGYTVICKQGEHLVCRKKAEAKPEERNLLFLTEEMANLYIAQHLDPLAYRTEAIGFAGEALITVFKNMRD